MIFGIVVQIHASKSCVEIFGVGVIKKGWTQSGVFACWYKFRKAKSWFNDFDVGMVKNIYTHQVGGNQQYSRYLKQTSDNKHSEFWLYN